MNRTGEDRRPVIALTMGDPNGIGPEVCLKALLSPVTWRRSRPFLAGSYEVFEFYRKKFRIGLTLFPASTLPVSWERNVVPVIGPGPAGGFRITPGIPGKSAATLAAESLVRAVGLWNENMLDAVVTGPVTKSGLHRAGFRYPGQTEMLASLTGERNVMMMMISGKLRVGLLTIHIPLKKVSATVTPKRLSGTIALFAESLRRDFDVVRPRIAVLGLNPHAGEGGMIGTEERRLITPVLRKMKENTMTLSGPFPADGFFGSGAQKAYDGILAMYHDQGLIPTKMSGLDKCVNFSAGLSIIRTSPGHGTAFDLAGKGVAGSSGMIEAVRVAAEVALNRERDIRSRVTP